MHNLKADAAQRQIRSLQSQLQSTAAAGYLAQVKSWMQHKQGLLNSKQSCNRSSSIE